MLAIAGSGACDATEAEHGRYDGDDVEDEGEVDGYLMVYLTPSFTSLAASLTASRVSSAASRIFSPGRRSRASLTLSVTFSVPVGFRSQAGNASSVAVAMNR
jgi:hypothetical protein